MKGDLAEGLLPSLLREIYVGRRNGWLHLTQADERHSLRFKRGHIVNAHTNVVEQRLGEMLVRHGRLSAADLARATEIVIRDRKRLGVVLAELGLMDASGLEDAVATHAYETLARVFSWTRGGYSFEEEEETPDGELTLKLSTGELILAAVRAIADPGAVRAALGDMDRALTHSSDPFLRFQKLTLSPSDGFLLSRVDGSASANEIVQMSPLASDDAERSLLGLLSTGFIEYGPEARPARRSASGPAAAAHPSPPERPPSPKPPPPRASPPPAPAPAPAPVPATPAAAAQPPAPASADEKTEERRREILAMWETLKTRNHFEVLGLSRSVGESEVKEAYFRLAKRFHPDVHHGTSLGDLHDKLEAVFIRLGDAYEVLRDPRRRGDYESRLGRARPATPGSASPVPPASSGSSPRAEGGTAAPPEEDAGAERAEEAVDQAVKLFEQQQYWDAIQRLEPVLRTAQGRVRTRGRMLLARAYLKNPKWARRAEETLLELTREDPKVANAWALLGGIYDGKGMRARALSMYKKTLELQPDHEEAQRYVASQAPLEPPPPAEAPPGLFRKLFRKP